MSQEKHNHRLLGLWRLDPADRVAQQSYGDITLKFGADGILLYTVHENDKDQVIRLAFRVEDNFILTDQPSEPRSERTAYEITADGKLMLTLGDEKSCYVRVA